MSQERPASVKVAVWGTFALVALSGVASVLTIVFRGELTDAWKSGHTDLGSVEAPSIAPVAVVMLIVMALLAVVIVEFFRGRHPWARWALTGTIAVMVLGTLATLRIGPPALFVVVSVLGLLLQVVVLVALWRRETSVYLRVAPAASDSHVAS